uniref:NADH-ubiquinone oxidoreductase chain 4L n=1 Tax=Rhizophydium sp. 136 TaxID=60187 RepID=Q950L7_9FUNG|nr:NADH dehydrogenase subunit 4L [Rhizophydium sp. 136]AAK84291.1 NADH dehydrogenase subunit 4L [Rhizophydium sp. 136]
MSIINFGLYFAIILLIVGLLAFVFNGSNQLHYNLIILIISLELLLLAIGLLFAHMSFILDDFIGTSITFYLLPLAGAESSLLLSIIIAYYPKRGTLTI